MQLKFLKTVAQPQDSEGNPKIVSLCYGPNRKLAVATADRQVFLYDENGDKRDRFSTKPSDPESGKMSYVITCVAFSPDGTKLAVGQSDCIVYVYKLGEKWGEKKAICNKFPQGAPVLCLIWLSSGPIICGLSDGKVRALQTKSNKSQSLYASDSLVVSLCPNPKGTGFLSGHVDGNVIRFVIGSTGSDEPQGRVVVHSVPPTALAWTQSHIFVAGCNNVVSVHTSLNGKLVKSFDYNNNSGEDHGFTVATCSPSGQAVVMGSFDRLRLYLWNTRKSIWEEATPPKHIKNLYTVTSLAWSRDGTTVTCGGLVGTVMTFESVLKRTLWRDKYEITYVGSNQILVKHVNDANRSIIVKSQYEINDVRIMGHDSYLVARTEDTLIVSDLVQDVTSEVFWNNTNREKFYFDYPTVCLIFNAGELTLIEYGTNDILASVRTEFANPHLISVRLNSTKEIKRLAYLLDLKTIHLVDLISGALSGQLQHDSKIDWLELSETCHKLLFRDKKQRLFVYDTGKHSKQCIFNGVSFVQWIEGSDVPVAQCGNTLAIWYNIDESPTVVPVKGDVVDIVRTNGRTEAICVDPSGNTTSVELDEGLVEFGSALTDHDPYRAVLFLESMEEGVPEAQAMWQNLSALAQSDLQDLRLVERCHAALGNVAAASYLRDFVTGAKPSDSWAALAVLQGDLSTAENILLEHGDLDSVLSLYKRLHKWDQALRLAEARGYGQLAQLKEEHMSYLISTDQCDKVGQVMEREGKYREALTQYLKSNRLSRVPALILGHEELRSDQALVGQVLKTLTKHEMYGAAADIYQALGKEDLALECYKRGKIWNKAVDLARGIDPEQVVDLEESWGDHLVESKQLDAAISHYIEAGGTLKALDTAVRAKQWKKAVHIIKVIEDTDSVLKYYKTIANHFEATKEYKVAEMLYLSSGLYKEAVDMYNEAGHWDKAHSIASQHLDKEEVQDMYIKHAVLLEENGKYRDAEKLYTAVDQPDLAIAMYKRVELYDQMIRLVERHHPELLTTTHLHLGQQLERQGKYRAAEIHYLAIDDWKAAMNMYRTLAMWEEAYRVAKQNGGQAAANQVAFLWSETLPIESAIKLLNKYSILDQCVAYACDTYQFDFAFQLSKGVPGREKEVHYKYALALEDEGKFQQAETEFILADRAKEAILMYIHAKSWISALKVAEAHDPSSVAEVLQAQAAQCFHDREYSEFEVLLLRAQMPEVIVQQYKSNDMWVDALRVCKDYAPHLYPNLQLEYTKSHHDKSSDMNIETLLSRANEWALAGQHKQAIDCLLQVNTAITDSSVVKRALLRAADMVNKFLFGDEALEVIRLLSPRLSDIGEHTTSAQLYLSVDMMKEAIDTVIGAEDWVKARKIAKELDPGYESYVESKYKDRLLKKGDVEQLADVDLVSALNLLAEQGQWARCIEKAKAHNMPIVHKYVALYAAKLLKDGFVREALNLYTAHGSPAIPQNFNIYNHIASEIFGLADTDYHLWQQLRDMLLEVSNGLEVIASINMETKLHFRNLLFIGHLYALRAACRGVASTKSLVVKVSVALLRYTDIIPADKAFYEAGKDLRDDNKLSEAFVFLNHYLDLCEAVEEGEGQLVDHSDLVQTDFPSSIPIPAKLYLSEDPKEHDSIREWVLTLSMDQRVEQALPLDDRQLYEASLEPGGQACVVTGYPVRKHVVVFGKGSQQANRDAWSKLNMAAKMAPESHLPSVVSFIVKWCGNPNT